MSVQKGIILSIGEIVLDIYDNCSLPGGAPANFAFHCSRCGANSIFVSAIGEDYNGIILENFCKSKGLNFYFERNSFLTGTVNVVLDCNHIPNYDIKENASWDHFIFNNEIKLLVQKSSVISLGSLFCRTSNNLEQILLMLDSLCKNQTLFVDMNFRQNYYSFDLISVLLNRANYVKLSLDEYSIVCALFSLTNSVSENSLKCFTEIFNLTGLIITNGGIDSYVYENSIYSHLPSLNIEVIDTVGAGDSFGAAYIVSRMKSVSVSQSHLNAIKYSSEVCKIKGAWF